ncbi:hypothetical protein DBV39_14815 [Orrella marina]|uniref:Phosphate/phosphite/phosphonate ABC transporter substrate-binding protein n=1 Tax=Orrella marina TaxID=2163011 RepID=A0A2R4XLW6_9BURK|nr:hypothetical protein DBV39_14815 [Orrella marina]
MMTAGRLRACVFWLILTVLFLSCFGQARAEDARSLTLGVFAYRPAEQMQRLWEPVAQFLENALGDHQVDLRVLNQEELALAIRNGELDLVFTNPTH